jgi:diguanylate cyclase (GGDEF)-like protein
MVQDLSELQLLADRLGHQLLHDALTGLANRQLFGSRLESTVGQAPPDASITLCYLGLDALSAVNSGHGHEVGDRLLQTVAKRLEAVVAHERTLVARVGGDEFAILIEDAVDAPDIPTLVDRINADLGEPTYVDGRGIAVGASIGVVRQAAGAMSSRELFRAAEAAMRSAKATGKRQWVRFDPEHAAAVRQLDRLATELPAAWENGELGLGYLPVVRLDNRHVVGFRAVPCWSRSPGPDSCLRLAERVGLSALLTPWFLGQLCEQSPVVESLVSGSPGPLHRISLSRLQCGDADLVAAVSRALGATGISPRLLEIAFDTGALLDEAGDALDNLQVLADIGVTTALHSFTGGMRELVLLESAPVRSVILANLSTDAGPLSTVATARLIADLSQAGVRTRVDGVADTAAARHWADLGVWTASGSLFGEPATLDELVEQDGGAPTDPPAPH